jgi:hypothetical protein
VILASLSTVVGVIIGVVVALLVLFFLGGLYANSRRHRVLDARLRTDVEAADAALAEARAQDRGWERANLEAAVRAAVAPKEVAAMHLVRVVDKPGTESDQAVFHVVDGHGDVSRVTLGRRDGAWIVV